MKRRHALVAIIAAPVAAARAALERPHGKIPRIAWLGNVDPTSGPEARASVDAFRDELRRRGWHEGRDFEFVFRYADGADDRLAQIARELVNLPVDLIVASSGVGASAAQQATATIPIVFASVPDPAARGLVASLARPGANVTGIATQGDELPARRLQLLKEAFPSIRRVGLLAASAAATASAERGAKALGVELVITGAQRAEDLAAAIMLPKPVDAWQVQDGALYFAHRRAIVELVARQRVPAIYPHGVYVEAGGLMSYAADLKEQFRRAAAYVDRILRGARPAELPVEQPMSFKLTINLKTARTIGLDMPRALILRADEVLQ